MTGVLVNERSLQLDAVRRHKSEKFSSTVTASLGKKPTVRSAPSGRADRPGDSLVNIVKPTSSSGVGRDQNGAKRG